MHVKKGEEKEKRRGPSCLGVIESDLDIYLTNSACVGLRMLGFRLEHGILFAKSDFWAPRWSRPS